MEERQSDRHFIDFIDYTESGETIQLSGFSLYLYLNFADPTLIMYGFFFSFY